MPCKDDYWCSSGIDPIHWMGNGVFPCNWFRWVWRHILVDLLFASNPETKPEQDDNDVADVDETLPDDEDEDAEHQNDDEDEVVYEDFDVDDDVSVVDDNPLPEYDFTGNFDPEMLEQADFDSETFHDIEHRKSLKRPPKQKKDKWYKKAEYFLDWLNQFSRHHCKHPVRFYLFVQFSMLHFCTSLH